MNEKLINSDVLRADRGQIFALILALTFIGGAIYLGSIGATWTSVALGVGGFSQIISLFIGGGKNKANEKKG